MVNFPKMLYVGFKESHKHEVAQNEDHEAELRELGFVYFAELESEQAQLSSDTISSASSEDLKKTFVLVEHFDVVSEELVQKELQLSVAQKERDQFKTETMNAADAVDYSSMTSEQLRSILDEKGIKYLVRDNKKTLSLLLYKSIK